MKTAAIPNCCAGTFIYDFPGCHSIPDMPLDEFRQAMIGYHERRYYSSMPLLVAVLVEGAGEARDQTQYGKALRELGWTATKGSGFLVVYVLDANSKVPE